MAQHLWKNKAAVTEGSFLPSAEIYTLDALEVDQREG